MLPSALGVEGYNPSVGGPTNLSLPGALDHMPAPAPPVAASQKPPEEVVSSSIATIGRYRTGGDGGNALKLLALFLRNIVENPTEEK